MTYSIRIYIGDVMNKQAAPRGVIVTGELTRAEYKPTSQNYSKLSPLTEPFVNPCIRRSTSVHSGQCLEINSFVLVQHIAEFMKADFAVSS